VTRIAVIYYSATGNVHELADALAAGARSFGAEVRLRRVPEFAPDDAIDANPDWRAHHDRAKYSVPEAELDDLTWADGLAFGTPTRFGAVSAQLKQFLDRTGGLWQKGLLADKTVTSFTSAANRHGGQETTIVSVNNVFYHWGAIIIPPGYTDDAVLAAGGNPYGVSWASSEGLPDEAALAAAEHQGRRLAEITGRLLAGSPAAVFSPA
jgi:NAD(P)H dehydrogenase (quinone)